MGQKEHLAEQVRTASLKKAFNQMADAEYGTGLKTLTYLGARIIKDGVLGLSGIIFRSELENKSLSRRQKILPILGKGLLIAFGGMAIIIGLSGAAFLAAPFMFAASIAGAIRSFTDYRKTKAEIKILNRELIKTGDLKALIAKAKLSPQEKIHVEKYCTKKDEIYNQLYQARNYCIHHSTLSTSQKKEFVVLLNQCIEGLSQNDFPKIVVGLDQLKHQASALHPPAPTLISTLASVSNDIYYYEMLSKQVEHLKVYKLSKDLKKTIEAYRLTHEKIYASDLPENLKADIIKRIEDGNVTYDWINNTYNRITNHYINTTSIQQVELLDQTFLEKLKFFHLKESEISQVSQYIEAPRGIYNSIKDLQKSIQIIPADRIDLTVQQEALNKCDWLIQKLSSQPSTFEIDEAQIHYFKNHFPILAHKIDELAQQDAHYRRSRIAFAQTQQYANLNPQKTASLKNAISSHLMATFQQRINSPGIDFSAPNVDFKVDKNNLYQKNIQDTWVARGADKLLKKFDRAIAPRGSKVKLKQAQLKGQQKAAFEQFSHQYGGTFDVIEKSKRITFLHSAAKKLLTKLGINLGIAGLSLITTVMIPTIASPAAPAALTAGAILGGVSLGLTGASLAISTDLIAREHILQTKLEEQKKSAGKSAYPDQRYEQSMLEQEKEQAQRQAQTTIQTKLWARIKMLLSQKEQKLAEPVTTPQKMQGLYPSKQPPISTPLSPRTQKSNTDASARLNGSEGQERAKDSRSNLLKKH